MDLSVIRQQGFVSNMSAREKAEALFLEREVDEVSKDEWRELIAGVPADVKKEIGKLKSAGTRSHLCISL